ncbi:MAG: DUF3299 domain-containing protein [Burkholderiaceae bacterium]|jgi:hypothetical protein|nr:DUF3299 domain-containing protein [Burkholderiaceae bacterium]
MKPRRIVPLLTAGVLLAGGFAHAQLSSPMPGVKPAQKSAAPAPVAATGPAGAAALGVPAGTGPGVHSPDSPFAPLAPRADVVPWSVLTSVKTKTEKNRILPAFEPAQLMLNQKSQRIQGFMLPLDPGEKQTHFLLSSVPLSCGFCVPGGPESMVEVKTRTPVKATLEPVVVEGRFLVLADDPYGLYYRMTDAVSIK